MPRHSDKLKNDIGVYHKSLCGALGWAVSIVYVQIGYWCDINEKAGKVDTHFHEGRWWMYSTAKEFTKRDFFFMSPRTIERHIATLRRMGLLEVGNFNRAGYDNTNWYSPNLEKFDEFMAFWEASGRPVRGAGGAQSKDHKAFLKAWCETLSNPRENSSRQVDGTPHTDKLSESHRQVDGTHTDKLTVPIPETTRDYPERNSTGNFSEIPGGTLPDGNPVSSPGEQETTEQDPEDSNDSSQSSDTPASPPLPRPPLSTPAVGVVVPQVTAADPAGVPEAERDIPKEDLPTPLERMILNTMNPASRGASLAPTHRKTLRRNLIRNDAETDYRDKDIGSLHDLFESRPTVRVWVDYQLRHYKRENMFNLAAKGIVNGLTKGITNPKYGYMAWAEKMLNDRDTSINPQERKDFKKAWRKEKSNPNQPTRKDD